MYIESASHEYVVNNCGTAIIKSFGKYSIVSNNQGINYCSAIYKVRIYIYIYIYIYVIKTNIVIL